MGTFKKQPQKDKASQGAKTETRLTYMGQGAQTYRQHTEKQHAQTHLSHSMRLIHDNYVLPAGAKNNKISRLLHQYAAPIHELPPVGRSAETS